MRRDQTVTADQQAHDWKPQHIESKIQRTGGNFLMKCTEVPQKPEKYPLKFKQWDSKPEENENG